jgi:hypothetical protein
MKRLRIWLTNPGRIGRRLHDGRHEPTGIQLSIESLGQEFATSRKIRKIIPNASPEGFQPQCMAGRSKILMELRPTAEGAGRLHQHRPGKTWLPPHELRIAAVRTPSPSHLTPNLG